MAEPKKNKDIQELLQSLPPSLAKAVVLPLVHSKDGQPLPQIPGPRGAIPLHSRYNPGKDWESFLNSPPGLDVIIGLGNGQGLLQRQSSSTEIWIIEEPKSSSFRQSLEISGVAQALQAPQVRILFLDSTANLGDYLAQDYHPRLQGPLNIYVNPVLARQHPETYGRWHKEALLQDRLWKIQGKTYSFFGGRWVKNMLRNLEQTHWSSSQSPKGKRFIITAAGPSLEDQWSSLDHQDGDIILATDTSLPWLKAQGIQPWAVLSIDAQYHTLRHFPGIQKQDLGPGGILQDLSSPPGLLRRYDSGHLYYSNHPFTHWLEHKGLKAPRLQMGLGNVTAVAVDLAYHHGAEQILVLGADFCYPKRNAYLRGTFIHRLWGQHQNRLSSIHHANYQMSALREGTMAGENWHSPVMDQYKQDLEDYCSARGNFFWKEGCLHFRPEPPRKPKPISSTRANPAQLAAEYRRAVQEMPEKQENQPLWQFRQGLALEQSWILSTLFPLISSAPKSLEQKEIFAWLKDWIGRY